MSDRIDFAVGKFGQGVVRILLFGQRLVEELYRILHAKLGGPGSQRAVTRNLIMFDGLRCRQKTGIQRRLILILLHDFLALIEDAFNGVAFFSASRLVQQFENLFQPLCMNSSELSASRTDTTTPWVPRNPRKIDGPAQVRDILVLAA